MRSLAHASALALLTCWNTVACLAQRPSGPRTLEGLLNAANDNQPRVPTEQKSPAASPSLLSGKLIRPKDGIQHPDLDKAWADYEAAIAKASESIKAVIAQQFDAATAKGDLDAAEKWQGIGEKFEKTGEMPTESETKAAVRDTAADYEKARVKLSESYEAVVKALTMEKKISEAKATRAESRLMGSVVSVSDKLPNTSATNETLTIEQVRNLTESGQLGSRFLRKAKALDAQTAAALVGYAKGSLPLDGLETLSPEVAKALAQHEGDLTLNGLTTLSDEAAKALAQHKGSVSLNRLETLSDEAAKALAQHEGDLTLNGLTTLSDEAAKALTQHKGSVSLNRLETLSDEAAKALAQHKGRLSLGGLTTLSDEAAKALAKRGGVWLGGLTTMSDEVITLLAQHDGNLSLDRLTTLSAMAAESLAKHKGNLSLNGLTTLSAKAAESLAKHKGSLSLNGLTTLYDEEAKALAKHKGSLSLDGLTTLSDGAANALADCADQYESLSLNGLTMLSELAVKSLHIYPNIRLPKQFRRHSYR